jgi:hypothetical protein
MVLVGAKDVGKCSMELRFCQNRFLEDTSEAKEPMMGNPYVKQASPSTHPPFLSSRVWNWVLISYLAPQFCWQEEVLSVTFDYPGLSSSFLYDATFVDALDREFARRDAAFIVVFDSSGDFFCGAGGGGGGRGEKHVEKRKRGKGTREDVIRKSGGGKRRQN